MSKRSYVPPIEIRVGQNRNYQKGVDRMTCKHPGCRRWRVDGTTKFCQDHKWPKESGERKRAENAAVAAWLLELTSRRA